jgi:FtsZ-binding cell division protein ZapB
MGNTLKRELQPTSEAAKRMEISELTKVLSALGCPANKSAEMAEQLDKRARQLAAQKSRSYEEALQHLLNLMKQGWAAQKK